MLSNEGDTKPEPFYRSSPGLAGFKGTAYVERKIQKQMVYTTNSNKVRRKVIKN